MTRLTKQQIADNTAAAAQVAADQQAELKRLRAAKRAASKQAKQAQEHADTVQPDPLHANIEDLFGDLPSPRRVMVGIVLGVLASGAAGYGIGMLAAYAIAGIVTLTTTAWLALALTVVTWILAAYAAWKIGGYVGGAVFSSVVMPDGLASRSAASLSNAVSGARTRVGSWFTPKKVEEFTGAHAAS